MRLAGHGRTKKVLVAAAAPLVLRAALRVRYWNARLPLDELVDRLRDVPPLFPSALRNPEALQSCAEVLLDRLPLPAGGRCWRRSLLLLDLWARCGLRPRLVLGLGSDDPRRGHAWIRAEGPGGELRSTPQGDFSAGFVF